MTDNGSGKRRVGGGTGATSMEGGLLSGVVCIMYDKIGGMHISMIITPKIRVLYLKIILPIVHDTHFSPHTLSG